MPTPLRRRLRWVRRGAGYAVAAALLCAALVVGALSQLLPMLERNPATVAAWLSQRAGQPVQFDRLDARWTRRGPLLRFQGLRLGRGQVRVGQAELLVSMYAGLLPGHSFSELRLRGLSLTLQRGDDGRWSVRGLPGSGAGGDPLGHLEGLGELQVIDSQLAVVAPSLHWNTRLPRIDLRLRVEGSRVRGGARVWARREGVPLAAAFDVDRRRGDGRAYVGAPDADLAQWSALLPGQAVVQQGRGQVRVWSRLRGHRVVRLDGDLRLRELRLAGQALPQEVGIPQVALDLLQAQVRWAPRAGGWRLDVPRLRLGRQDAPEQLQDVTVAMGEDFAVLARSAQTRSLLQLLALSGRLPPATRRWLLQAQPDVHVSDLAIGGRRQGPLQASARVRRIELRPVGDAPGVSGLAGQLLADRQGLRLQLDPRAPLRVDWPAGFGGTRDTTLSGALAAWREDTGWRVGTPGLRIQGGDYGIDLRGRLWFQGDGSRPHLDLAARLDTTPVTAAKQFWVRHRMPAAAIDWLDHALAGGQLTDARVLVGGDLDDWPFAQQNGRFEAAARLTRARLAFQPGWPPVENVEAQMAFFAEGFTVEGTGELAGIPIRRVTAGIDDYRHGRLTVQAAGATDARPLLALLRRSPLHATHAETLDNLSASGPAQVDFLLDLPMRDGPVPAHRISGSVDLQGARLADPRYQLALEQVRGQARYNESGFAAEGLSVVRQGQAGSMDLRAGGDVRDPAQVFEGQLSLPLTAPDLLGYMPELNWLAPYIEGRSRWVVNVDVARDRGTDPGGTGALRLRSDLIGTALKLPAPMDKPAFLALPTTVSARLPVAGSDIDVAFGQLLSLRARSTAGRTGVRLQLGGGRIVEAAPAAGLVVLGRTRTLDALDWIDVARSGSAPATAGATSAAASTSNPTTAAPAPDPVPLQRVDVRADRLRLLGSEFPDTRLQMGPAGPGLSVQVDGPALAGTMTVPSDTQAAIEGQLARVHWKRAAGATPPVSDPAAAPAASPVAVDPADAVDPANVPSLALDIEDLRFGEARLGQARLRTRRQPDGMRIQQLQLRADGQKIDIDGDWSRIAGTARTHLRATLDSQDYGRLLDSLGQAGRLSGGQGTVTLDAAWPGSPADFALARLDGRMDVDTRNGQLLEVEPGAGRVLGLLSLAQLPRRIVFDFSDLFSKGLAFNRLHGHVDFGQGSARSDDLVIDGPAADIRIRGATDLAAQRFDQTIQVLPKSGNLLAVVGAVAGGPVGAAVGAAANAMLAKPLGAIGAKTYRVTGPWKEPQVEVIDRDDPAGPVAAPVPAMQDRPALPGIPATAGPARPASPEPQPDPPAPARTP